MACFDICIISQQFKDLEMLKELERKERCLSKWFLAPPSEGAELPPTAAPSEAI